MGPTTTKEDQMKFKFLIPAIAFTVLIAESALAVVTGFDFGNGKGSVTFQAVGKPSAIKINGTGEATKGNLALGADKKVAGVLTFDLKSLTTGIDMRDHHMKEKYLEVEKFPTAQLTIKDLAVPDSLLNSTAAEAKDLAFTGKLKLKGVEKDVKGVAQIKRDGANLQLTANFSIQIEDFGIDIPKYLGITVANEVKIEVASQPVIKD